MLICGSNSASYMFFWMYFSMYINSFFGTRYINKKCWNWV
jgi:hypothetical protein